MANSIIKFTKETYKKMHSLLLQDHQERHAFALCHIAKNENSTIFLVDKIIYFDEDEIEFSAAHVRIGEELVNGIFHRYVNSEYDGLISCHSHPFEYGNVWFSSIDDLNDHKLFEYFTQEILPHKPNGQMATMVWGQKTIASRDYDADRQEFDASTQIVVMDYPLRYITPTNQKGAIEYKESQIHHRQVLAFGSAGQELLGKLKVSLIGVGGTGSILAEALTRLGVRDLCIIDDDRLEESNLNRWQGGKISDIGRYKVDIIEENLKDINPTLSIKKFQKNIFDTDVIASIKDSDIIIGAVDSNKARYLLNRVALQYLIPYLDCSSGIVVKEDIITTLAVRNVIVVPSITPCFNCEETYYKKSDFVYDFLPTHIKEEAKRRKYIQSDEDIPSPSVYPINMLSASHLLLEMINLLWRYKESHISNIYLNTIGMHHSQQIAWSDERPNKLCIDCQDRLGLGDSEDISELFFKES